MKLTDFLNCSTKVQLLPDFDMKPDTPWQGIRAICYEGADYKGKKTKVFAHIGFPASKEGEQVPAVVLVHGGGGHPFPEWIRLWNERGFAAIAMSTTGHFPKEDQKGIIGTETAGMTVNYTRELYGDLVQDGYTTGPDNAGMWDHALPLEEQWMYHAVADTILAHNILRADDRVNSAQIGICGISWGAVITSLAIGYDNRYAFAVPIYGSGYLDYQPAPQLMRAFREPPVKELWSAANRFDQVGFPVLWSCWAYDSAFSIGGNSLSYLATKESGACLSIRMDMGHSHWQGWSTPEGYRFARGVLDGTLPLIRVGEEPIGFGEISFPVEVPADFADLTAEVCYLTEPMTYDEKDQPTKVWASAAAHISGNRVTARVPEGACCYFVTLTGVADGVTYVTQTALVEKE